MSQINVDNAIKSFILVAFAAMLPVATFLSWDFFYGKEYLGSKEKMLALENKPYQQSDFGWYTLKNNYSGNDQFGKYIYEVATTEFGFRKNPNLPSNRLNDVIFLGDSFTYGINGSWNETFVGIYEEKSGYKVINAGVPSYSPTAYLHQYKKALSNNLLRRKHKVIIALDISDVQDEAGIWMDGSEHPIKRKAAEGKEEAESTGSKKFINAVIEKFPVSYLIYKNTKQGVIKKIPESMINLQRSGFTWANWAELDSKNPPIGYAPLGVKNGLSRISLKILSISEIARKYDAEVYILIYPWPAQVFYNDKFSWSEFAFNECAKIRCSGTVDLIPLFRREAQDDGNWYENYYIYNDIHFNLNGNQVLAQELLNRVGTNHK